MTNKTLITKLDQQKKLPHPEWVKLISTFSHDDALFAAELARKIALSKFGNNVFFRGIIEFTNVCKNNCLYCGIRRENACVSRYRLSDEDILECCREGYSNGFRTFVLQGGEDAYMTDERMCDIIGKIKQNHPDCAVTLSLGERSRKSYEKMFEAGANRYLLRHEAADPTLYAKLHEKNQSLENRIRCLYDLKEIGYQTGCGFMVGAPFQTAEHLAADMEFITDFDPEMIGIGPFIPHSQTPFANFPAGSVELTLFMISLCRIALPDVLLPSTTALGTVSGDGRKRGVLCGCNVVMPNLSPEAVRKKYMLYDNKSGTELSAAKGVAMLREQMEEIGYNVVCAVGNHARFSE